MKFSGDLVSFLEIILTLPSGRFRRHFAVAITGILRLRERGLESGNQEGSMPSAATRAPGPASIIPCINSVGLPGFAAWARSPESARFCVSSSLILLCKPPISSRRPCEQKSCNSEIWHKFRNAFFQISNDKGSGE